MYLRRLKQVLIWLSAIIVLLAAAIFVILRYYEDDVVAYALEKGKSKLVSEFTVSGADLTFWETFPNASIRFSDVKIEDTFGKHDTLIYAKKVYLGFSLFDLFRGNYTLKKIEVSEAQTNLRVDKTGKDNWHFWKSDSTSTEDLNVKLRSILLAATNIHYSNSAEGVYVSVYAESTRARGDFNSKQFLLDLEYNGVINNISNKSEQYINNRSFVIQSQLDTDLDKNIFSIKDATIKTNDLSVLASGNFGLGSNQKWDLQIKGDDIELDELLSAIPQEQQKQLADYSPDGDIDLDMSIKGGKDLRITANMIVRDGQFKHKDSGARFTNIQSEAIYSNNNSKSELKLKKFTSNLNDGYVEVSGIIDQANIDLVLSASVDLESIRDFFAMDTLEECSGKINVSATLQGAYKKEKKDNSKKDYSWLKTSGTCTLTDGMLRLKNSNRTFSSLQTTIGFNNNDATIQNLSGNVNGNEFSINGSVSNLIPFIADNNERMTINASLQSPFINFANLVETESNNSSGDEYLLELPDRLDFNLNCRINKFVFRKFEAGNVVGVAKYKNRQLVVDPLSFNTAEGSFSAQLMLRESGANNYAFSCLATLKDINIQNLFTQFENFNQTFIQDKHLRGKATATVTFKSELSKSLVMSDDKIESIVDIRINNGELIGLESLQSIAQYVGENKLIAPFVNENAFAEKLRSVKFSQLENIIEIKNRQINIPLMDIRSSAMNILAKGKHGFDNKIDYTIGFTLRDILVKKEREWQETDDGEGRKLFIYMRGTTENPDFGVDREMAKNTRQQDILQEKQNVKALLKEEFGLFKKDQTIGTYQEKPVVKESTTTIQWDDFDEKPAVKQEQKTPVKSEPAVETKKPEEPKKKKPKWLQEKE